jgi:hypothetical protein
MLSLDKRLDKSPLAEGWALSSSVDESMNETFWGAISFSSGAGIDV